MLHRFIVFFDRDDIVCLINSFIFSIYVLYNLYYGDISIVISSVVTCGECNIHRFVYAKVVKLIIVSESVTHYSDSEPTSICSFSLMLRA